MDPNAALANAREARDNLVEQADSDDPSSSAIEQEALTLAESFTALDEWLKNDGFLPTDWDKEEYKPRTASADMPMGRALSLAIFCINTFMHPDASDPADVDALEAHSDEVIEALVELRNIYDATKKV